VLALLLAAPGINAQNTYIGAAGGITTLSADGTSSIDRTASAASSYKPENGATLRLFAGRHLRQYLSVEANYGWNRNALGLSSIRTGPGTTPEASYDQARTSRQHQGGVDLMLYFRNRESWARPYLAFGAGALAFASELEANRVTKGAAVLPPERFTATRFFVRTTVGIDLRFRPGWAFRYSFGETLSGNPISKQLSPPGSRNLAGFQNLWGILRTF
jgi:hypothetical protein